MKKFVAGSIIISAFIGVLTSCVPAKKLDECNAKVVNCETELSNAKKAAQETEIKLKELQEKFDKIYKEEVALMRDTAIMGTGFRHLTVQYDKLNTTNNELQKQITELLRLAQQSAQKLSADLQISQDQLMKKQEELKLLESVLNKQKSDLETLGTELKNREMRVQELEDLLKKKGQDAEILKKKLSEALFNFENKGLTITQKNGKVYVSMDESLLFASGKTTVEPKGVDALKNLAKVLEQNPEINVMVEGHTDNQPMKGSGEIKDNWDLSVMRATSVTKIILSGTSIDAKRITAAGRGEFFPIENGNSSDARKKNRRTEIILTPKLDELLKVLDRN